MKKSLWIAMAAMVGLGVTAQAATNASINAQWTFEELANGATIPAANQNALADPNGTWVASTNGTDTAYASNTVPAPSGFGGDFYLTNAHARGLYFDGSVTNQFSIAQEQRFVTEFLLKPGQLEDESLLNQIDASSRLAFWFGTNGFFTLKHAKSTDLSTWQTSTGSVVYDSNAWVRIAIEQDYTNVFLSKPTFAVTINGVVFTNANGLSRSANTYDVGPGPWFPMMFSGSAADLKMNALVGMGIGMLDDVRNYQWASAGGGPTEWEAWQIANFGSTTAPNSGLDDHADSDLVTNYQEYLAGTDPNDPTSYLKIQSITINGGNVVISFVGSAAGATGKSYILRSYTNAAGAGDYEEVDTEDKAGGTINMQAPSGQTNRFFKIVVPE